MAEINDIIENEDNENLGIDDIEELVNPEVPDTIDNQQLTVYMPLATGDTPGIAMFDKDDFVVDESNSANVTLKKKVPDFDPDDFVEENGVISLNEKDYSYNFNEDDFAVDERNVSLKNKPNTFNAVDFNVKDGDVSLKKRIPFFNEYDFDYNEETNKVSLLKNDESTLTPSDFNKDEFVFENDIVSLKNKPHIFDKDDFDISDNGEVSLKDKFDAGSLGDVTFDKDDFNVSSNGEVSLKDKPSTVVDLPLQKGDENYSLKQETPILKENTLLSQSSVAYGENNVSGCKGYFITEIYYGDDSNKPEVRISNEQPILNGLTISSKPLSPKSSFKKPQYVKDDKFNLTLGDHYFHIGTITAVQNDIITFTGDISSLKSGLTNTANQTTGGLSNAALTDTRFLINVLFVGIDDYSLCVPRKPTVGVKTVSALNFVEGGSSKASGIMSHAEGRSSVAGGAYAHAEGRETLAGYAAHAEGYQSQATGQRSHAEGWYSKAYGQASHAEGRDTTAEAHRSHAEGWKTKATAVDAHAEGRDTTASGGRAHAEGYLTIAKGMDSHAEGYDSEANYNYSHAEGKHCIADAESAHAEGDNTLAEGIASHAEGCQTTAGKDYSHAEGYLTTASGQASHVEGKSNTAEGECSHAEGLGTYAKSTCSHAEGFETKALQNTAHAEGDATTAEGWSSHAEGYHTLANKGSAHAEGFYTKATGDYSHSEGSNTVASGPCSHAAGLGTIASGTNQTVVGQYNEEKTNALFIVGKGTGSSKSSRSNAFEVLNNGTVKYKGQYKVATGEVAAVLSNSSQVVTLVLDFEPNLIVVHGKDSTNGSASALWSNGRVCFANEGVRGDAPFANNKVAISFVHSMSGTYTYTAIGGVAGIDSSGGGTIPPGGGSGGESGGTNLIRFYLDGNEMFVEEGTLWGTWASGKEGYVILTDGRIQVGEKYICDSNKKEVFSDKAIEEVDYQTLANLGITIDYTTYGCMETKTLEEMFTGSTIVASDFRLDGNRFIDEVTRNPLLNADGTEARPTDVCAGKTYYCNNNSESSITTFYITTNILEEEEEPPFEEYTIDQKNCHNWAQWLNLSDTPSTYEKLNGKVYNTEYETYLMYPGGVDVSSIDTIRNGFTYYIGG